jgi:hypothetical protein
VEKEFGPSFIELSFNWFEVFSCIGKDLQVRHICSYLGSGVSYKYYPIVASDMCKDEGWHSNISRFYDSFVNKFESIVSGGDSIID